MLEIRLSTSNRHAEARAVTGRKFDRGPCVAASIGTAVEVKPQLLHSVTSISFFRRQPRRMRAYLSLNYCEGLSGVVHGFTGLSSVRTASVGPGSPSFRCVPSAEVLFSLLAT